MTSAYASKPSKDPKTAALLRARYRAEGRYRLYGIASLVVSALFLVALLSNILMTGMACVLEPLARTSTCRSSAELIDPEGKKSPDVLAAADYNAVARDALAAAVPGRRGARCPQGSQRHSVVGSRR